MRSETRAGIWTTDIMANSSTEVVAPVPFLGSVLVTPTVGWLGNHIVYTSTAGGRTTVTAIRPGAGSEEIASNGFEGVGAPDGQTVVFRSIEGGSDGLWRISADGRQRVQLVSGHVRSPVMTPDGQVVLFASNRRGPISPWMVSVNEGEGEPTQVTTTSAGAASLDVSPDGRMIVFNSQGDQGRRIWVTCDLPACTARKSLPVSGSRPRWTPDGRGIASIDQAESNIWIHPLDGSPGRQLTRFTDGRRIADFAWSHDGQRLAISRVEVRNDIVLFRGLR